MSLVTKCFWTEKRLGVLAVLVVAIAVIVAIPGPAADAAPGWNNAETLDSGVSTGTDTATNYYPIYQQHHVFNQGIESAQPVLRHGWFQPGFSNWAFETLDAGVSTGRTNVTNYYPIYQQHHVFDQGIESAQSVLRHGWFQPGFSSWAFETLDAGVATGTDTATVVFGDQHHLFTHGLDAGQDVLRHGWFDPAVGAWQFQTLDAGQSVGRWLSAMVSDKWGPQLHVFGSGPPTWPPGTFDYPEGSLRHGWYSETEGWQFETLYEGGDTTGSGDPLPAMVGKTAAWVGSEGNQNVVSSFSYIVSRYCSEPCGSVVQKYYDGTGWVPSVPGYECRMTVNGEWICATGSSGLYPAVALNPYNSNVELLNKWLWGERLEHVYWDGSAWHSQGLGGLGGRHNSATAYPVFNQVHVFHQTGAGLDHLWWNPS